MSAVAYDGWEITSTEHVTDDTWAFHTPQRWRHEFVDDTSRTGGRTPLLDRRSDPHWITDMLMHDALRRLLLMCDGRALPLREKVTGSRAGATAPSSTLAAEIDALWRAYERASTHRRRFEAILAAQDAAVQLAYAPDRSKVRGTQEWKDAIRADSRSCRVLAVVYGVSYRTIARIKKAS